MYNNLKVSDDCKFARALKISKDAGYDFDLNHVYKMSDLDLTRFVLSCLVGFQEGDIRYFRVSTHMLEKAAKENGYGEFIAYSNFMRINPFIGVESILDIIESKTPKYRFSRR